MKVGLNTLESMSQATWYNSWTLEKFKDFLKGDILEVGCGIGNFTKELLNYGRVFAIDIDTEYVKKLRKDLDGKATVGFGDIEKDKYFFGDQKFDTIVCLNVLEHIENDQTALLNLTNLLRKRGYLILLVPAHPILYGEIDKSIGHFRRYQKKQLVKVVSSGLKIILSRRINLLGALGWWFSGKVLKDSQVNQSKVRIFNLIAPFFLKIENIFEPLIGTSILLIAQKNR